MTNYLKYILSFWLLCLVLVSYSQSSSLKIKQEITVDDLKYIYNKAGDILMRDEGLRGFTLPKLLRSYNNKDSLVLIINQALAPFDSETYRFLYEDEYYDDNNIVDLIENFEKVSFFTFKPFVISYESIKVPYRKNIIARLRFSECYIKDSTIVFEVKVNYPVNLGSYYDSEDMLFIFEVKICKYSVLVFDNVYMYRYMWEDHTINLRYDEKNGWYATNKIESSKLKGSNKGRLFQYKKFDTVKCNE